MDTARNHSDELLERCLSAMRDEGCSVEECLARYPHSAELEPLLRAAARLQAARELQPSPQFRAESLQRLRRQASPAPGRRAAPWPLFSAGRRGHPIQIHPRPFLALLLVLALIASGIGAVGASAQALPGDWLYPVKRAQEDVQLSLALDDPGRAALHLQFASRRLGEAAELVEKQRAAALGQTLTDFNRHVQADLSLLAQGSALNPSEQVALANQLVLQTLSYESSLATLAPAIPDTAQDSLAAARLTSRQARIQANQVIQNGGSPTSGATASPTPTPSQTAPAASPTPFPPTSTRAPAATPSVPSSTPPASIQPRASATLAPKPSATKPSPAGITRTPSSGAGPSATPPPVIVKPTATRPPASFPPTRTPSTGNGPGSTATKPPSFNVKPSPTPKKP